MADRVSATIAIGGTISSDVLPKLFEAIGNDDARVDWDGEPFVPEDVPSDGPLELKAHEVAWGCFREIEALCIEHGIAFVRWSGGSSGSFGPERIVFTGSGDVTSHAVTGDDVLTFDIDTIRQLGSIAAIEEDAAVGDFRPPALVIVDDDGRLSRPSDGTTI